MNRTDKNILIIYENLKKVNSEFELKLKEKFNDFIDKGWYILGDEVNQFEQNFAKYCGVNYCVGVANGLDALILGIKAFDFPKGSEIIVPSNTYIATILAIINAGHIPVLVEPDITTYNIDPNLIEKKISKKTKAIIPVHLYGLAAQMDKICEISEKNNLEIIEDCAQAHGALFNNKMVGTFGKVGAYSFYPTKNLGGLGDAGAIITSEENIYVKIKALRNYGSQIKYYNRFIGLNSRLDEIQAAFLNIKLPYLDKINQHKRKLANVYLNLLTDSIIKPVINKNGCHVYHIFNIRTEKRDELKYYLLKEGIQTEIHYPIPPNKQEGYSHIFKKTYSISEEIHASTLSLPISYSTSVEEVDFIVNKINSYYLG